MIAQRPLPLDEPAFALVTLAEVKSHLRIDFADEDSYLQTLLDAATEVVDGPEGALNRCLRSRTWVLSLSEFPSSGCALSLPLFPVQAVEVAYRTSAGLTTMPVEDYALRHYPAADALETVSGGWPSALSVEIEITAGYVNAAAVPAVIKLIVFCLVAEAYSKRTMPTVDMVPQSLARQFKRNFISG